MRGQLIECIQRWTYFGESRVTLHGSRVSLEVNCCFAFGGSDDNILIRQRVRVQNEKKQARLGEGLIRGNPNAPQHIRVFSE